MLRFPVTIGGSSGATYADGAILAQYSDNNLYVNNQENGAIRFFTNNGDRGRFDADGLKFGTDTAAANALDKYEQGTFSPIIKRLMSNGTTETNYYTHTHRQGVYTRIGNRVWITGRCHWSGGSTGSGSLILTSLPYTVSSTNSGANEVPLNVGYRSGLNYENITGYAVPGLNRFMINYFDSNGTYTISPSTGNSTGSLYFHATYEVT